MLGKGLESSSVGKALSMDKALGPVSSTDDKQQQEYRHTLLSQHLGDTGGLAVLVHPQLLSEFKASLGHMRSSLKKTAKM